MLVCGLIFVITKEGIHPKYQVAKLQNFDIWLLKAGHLFGESWHLISAIQNSTTTSLELMKQHNGLT